MLKTESPTMLQYTIVALVVLVIALSGCRPNPTPEPTATPPPPAVALVANPDITEVSGGQTVALTVETSGQNLRFKWSSARGKLSVTDEPAVIYTAPTSGGVDTVTVEVSSATGTTIKNASFNVVVPDTPSLTPSSTSTPIDTPTATPIPTLIVADFNSCSSTNNLNGPMGVAYNDPDMLTEDYILEPERGCVVRLEYHIQDWSAFWIKLGGVDLTPYSTLTFDIKADPQPSIPQEMKIELKRAGGTEVSIIYVSGITAEWQTKNVNLQNLWSTGFPAPLSSFSQMEELLSTFEVNPSGSAGVVYLDNIVFKR